MSFENAPQNIPLEKNAEQNRKKPDSKFVRGVKKTLAEGSSTGAGYFGSMGEGQAKGAENLVNFGKQGETARERISESKGTREKLIESSNLFEVLDRDGEFTWGVEYVKKQGKDGHGFLAERYIKINNDTKETTILGEYDNVLQVAEGISKMRDVPEKVREYAQSAASVIKTERAFQQSGLTEPGGYSGLVDNPETQQDLDKNNGQPLTSN